MKNLGFGMMRLPVLSGPTDYKLSIKFDNDRLLLRTLPLDYLGAFPGKVRVLHSPWS